MACIKTLLDRLSSFCALHSTCWGKDVIFSAVYSPRHSAPTRGTQKCVCRHLAQSRGNKSSRRYGLVKGDYHGSTLHDWFIATGKEAKPCSGRTSRLLGRWHRNCPNLHSRVKRLHVYTSGPAQCCSNGSYHNIRSTAASMMLPLGLGRVGRPRLPRCVHGRPCVVRGWQWLMSRDGHVDITRSVVDRIPGDSRRKSRRSLKTRDVLSIEASPVLLELPPVVCSWVSISKASPW